MDDQIAEYYMKQAGEGIPGYAGIRYQKGHGFFGRMVSGAVIPMLKKVLPFLGKTALTTGLDIAKDVTSGESFKRAAKTRLREAGRTVEDKAMSKIQSMTGNGRKKRRRMSKKNVACVSFRKNKRRKTRKRKSTKSKKRRSRSTSRKVAQDFL